MAYDAEALLRRQGQLETLRSNFDAHWDEVADYVVPNSARFQSITTPGQRKMEKVFDSTPIAANEYFAAAMQSMLTPATQRWHRLIPVDAELADDYEVRDWCDEATDVLFHLRYSPRAQFGQAIGEAFLSFGAFGNAVIMVEDNRGQHLVYRAGHPKEFYYAENQWGVIDTMHRKFELNASAAVEKFGEMLPPEITEAEKRSPDTLFTFLHVVEPNKGDDRRTQGLFAYRSCYVSLTGKKIVREGGYRSFPYSIARYSTSASETYGRGPGISALPDIKMLNEMMKSIIRAAQKVVSPALLLPDRSLIQAFSTRPDALNYGGMDRNGKHMVAPLETHANINLGIEMVQDVRRRIEQVFKVDLFRVLVDKPASMTATEALIRAQEKGALLAPVGQRAQGEFLGSMIYRELDIAHVAGLLPPIPDALMVRGGMNAIKVEHEAPVNQFQKAEKGVAINQFLSSVQGIASVEPDALDAVDFDEVVREMHDIAGAPQRIMRTAAGIATIREQKQQRAQAADALAAAQQSGAAAKDWSKAQANAASVPPTTGALLG